MSNDGKRWHKAQKAENEFHRKRGAAWRMDTKSSELDEEKRQNRLLGLLNVTRSSVDDLKSKTLLEIGGAYYAQVAADIIPGIEAIALDPLINLYQNNSDKCKYYAGKAEKIPLNDNSVDICVCRNAIDHMESPEKALREIRRVLNENGKLYISCNVFAEWARPFFPIFDFLDRPHPHHYSKSSFLNLLTKNKYQIDFSFSGDSTNIQDFKTFIGKIMRLRHLAFYCSITGN